MDFLEYILLGFALILITALVVACIAVCKRYNGFAIGGFIGFFPKDYPRCLDRDCATCDELCLKRGKPE
jgi:hypothetical protein